jgi:hypothetical protein
MNSMFDTRAPARQAIAMPSPVAPARRGREQIGPPRAAGRQDRRARGVQVHPAAGAVDGIDAPHIARARIALFVPRRGEVDRDLIGHQRDVGVRGRGAQQRLLHRPAGRVGDMNDPAVRMPTLARQVQRARLLGKRHAQFTQPRDRGGRLRHHELDDRAIVQPRARDHRILDMVLERVARLQHRRDAALRPCGGPFVQRALGEHGDAEPLGERQRRGQPRRSGADDQDVAVVVFGHVYSVRLLTSSKAVASYRASGALRQACAGMSVLPTCTTGVAGRILASREFMSCAGRFWVSTSGRARGC